MADPFAVLSKPVQPVGTTPSRAVDPFAQLSKPVPAVDPFAQLSSPKSSPLNVASTPSAAESLDKEIADRGAFDKPAVASQPITDAELEVLAKKHGVKSSVLRAGLTSFGGATENKSDFLDKVGSLFNVASAGAGFDVPTKVAKKLMPDNYEMAFDDLQELASGRKSYAVKTAETAAGVLTGGAAIKGAKTLWQVARPLAAMGAAGGFGASRKGDEVQSAAIGAVGGAALGAAGHAAAPYASKAVKAVVDTVKGRLGTPTEVKLFERAVADKTVDIQKIIEKEAERTSGSSPILESALLNKRTVPLPNEVETIISEQIPDKIVEAALTRDTPMHLKMAQRVRSDALAAAKRSPDWVEGTVLPRIEVTEDQIRHQLAKDVLSKNAIAASDRITGGKATSTNDAFVNLDTWLSREGGLTPEGQSKVLKGAYKDYEQLKQGVSGLKSQHMEIRGAGGFMEKVLHGFSPKEQVFRTVDSRSNVGAEGALEKYNSAINQMNIAKNHFKTKILGLSDSWNKANLSLESRNKIYDALDTGATSGLSDIELKAANQHKEISDEIRDFANGVLKEKGEGITLPPDLDPIRIGNRKAFVHKALLDTNETIKAIRGKADEAFEDVANMFGGSGSISKFGDLTPAQFAEAKKLDSVRQLLWPLHSMSDKEIVAGQQLDNALSALNTRESRSKLETSARTAFSRSGQIPEYLQERQLNKLHGKYLENTLSHVFLRKAERDLKLKSDLLHAAGDVEGAKKISESIAGQHGTLSGSLPADFRARMAQVDSYFDKVAAKYGTDSIAGQTALAAKNIPAILQDISLQIYPNSMGWSIRSALQNQLQTISKTYPELGAVYGIKNMKTAVFNVAKNRAQYLDKASKWGLLQAEHIAGMEESIADGLRRSNSGVKYISTVLDKHTHLAMTLQRFAENNNRSVAVAAAEKFTQDLMENGGLALKALQKMPPHIQKGVASALSAGAPLEAERMLATHLVAQTQFFYSKASMSSFGHMLGPVFTPFTRWPTAVAGDIITELRTKKLGDASVRLAEKYMLPTILLATAQHALIGDPAEMSDTQRQIVGSGGLVGAAPGSAVKSIWTGDIVQPPLIKAVKAGVIDPLLRGEGIRAQDGMAQVFQTFTPGAGMYRAFGEDLYNYLESLQGRASYTKMKGN